MSWKKLPYWLKGGMIGTCIGIILVIIFLATNQFRVCYDLISEIGGFGIMTICNYVWQYYVITFLVFVLLGLIIGFIVGKNKKRESHK